MSVVLVSSGLDGDEYKIDSTFSNCIIKNGGFFSMEIFETGSAVNTTVSSGGEVYVYSNGVLEDVKLKQYGELEIYSGGTALNIDWQPFNGILNVHDGAYVTYASSYFGVYFGSADKLISRSVSVMQDKTASGKWAGAYVMSGGTASNFTVSDSAFIYVSSGGKTVNNTVSSGGTMKIFSGGTAENTVVDGGLLIVSSGASAFDVVWTPCIGDIKVLDGGYISYSQQYSGVYYRIDGIVSNSASVNGISLNAADRMMVMSGGTAENITVNKNADLTVYAGGSASIVFNPWQGTVNSHAGAEIENLERDNCIYLASNNILVSKFTKNADNLSLSKAHEIRIYDGGILSNIKTSAAKLHLSGGSVIDGNISGGTMHLSSGTITDTVMSGGKMVIYGGTAGDMNFTGGNISMYGGNVSNLTLDSKTSANFSGGTADDINLNSGNVTITSGAVSNIQTKSNTTVIIHNDGILDSGTVAGGSVIIYDGGNAQNLLLTSGGMITANNNASILKLTVTHGGSCSIQSGASASTVNVRENGFLTVANGASAMNIDWTPCVGKVTIHAGADFSFTSSFSGVYLGSNNVLLQNSMSMSETDVAGVMNSMYVMNEGSINDLNVASGGMIFVWQNGTASDININNSGYLYISSGANAENIIVNSNGQLQIDDGGIASDTVISKYGTLKIMSGAVHSGTLNIDANGTVIASSGAVINMDVSLRKISDSYIVTNMQRISSECAYSITVSAAQKTGTYKLASGINSFNGSISIIADSEQIGVLSVNGKFVNLNDISFSISCGNEGLLLNVTERDIIPPAAPEVTADIIELTNSSVTLNLKFADDAFENEYSVDGKTWKTITSNYLTVAQNGTFSFRSTDISGNVSNITAITVGNIDKEPPTLEVSGNATEWTNEDVILTANVSDGVVEYFDGENWVAGSTLTVSENGTYQFRVTDEAGNVTEKEVVVDKIDKVSPTLEITGNATAWTNKDVVLTANVSDGVVEYFDGENWVAGSTLTATENGTYQFRVTDEAGNVTEKEVVVDKIDKVAPSLEITGNAIAWTNKDVILTANASDGVVEYFDNGEWFIGNSLTVSENGTYQFRVTDEAGNVIEKEIVVDKIDKVAPTLEVTGNAENWTNQDVILTANVSDGVVEYFDGKNWVAGSTLTATENGTYQFRVTDEAGNVTEKEIVVDKIDKVAPTLEVSGNATAWTNQDVILTVNVSDGVVEYFDNGEWIIGNSLTVSENGTYQFRVTDEAGNITEKSVTVDKIDKVAPTLEVTGNAENWTNKDVVLTANVSDGVVEYFDGKNWVAGSTLTATENGTYQFRVTDEAGNVTEKEIVVDKIDKVAPTLEVSGNATAWTNKDVILTANVSDGVIEYFDGENWIAGSTLTATENGTYTFRVTDEAGNVTEKSVIVDKIDKVAPTLEVSSNTETWTNKDVILTANVSDGVVEYFDNGEWIIGNSLTVSENGTYQFRVTDEAGNVTEKEIVVDKIDKVAPTLEVTGNAIEWTNKDVILTANVSDGVVEYFDGENWIAGSTLTVSENGTYQFRVTDEAGNVTEKSVEVTYIDKVAPAKPVASADFYGITNRDITVSAVFSDDSVQKEYSFDNEKWFVYTTGIVFNENGEIYFRSFDAPGNISEVAYFEVNNIDKNAPSLQINGNAVTMTNQDVTLIAISDLNAAIYYSFNQTDWFEGAAVTVTENKTVYFKATNPAGNIATAEIIVDKIDKLLPEITFETDNVNAVSITTLAVSVNENAEIYYSTDNENFTLYTEPLTVMQNAVYYFTAEDTAGNTSSKSVIFENIIPAAYQELQGSADGVSWQKNIYPANIVEFSTDNFLTAAAVKTIGNAVDTFGMSAPEYQWRVKSELHDLWTNGDTFAGNQPTDTPEKFISDSNGNTDVFFAVKKGIWGKYFFAENTETGEKTALEGKNRIIDIFAGSSDANILFLTNDANGDALFADDIFSASFESLGETQSRIYEIKEINAGDGDDIIDLTSRRFECGTDGMTIYGGSGNDIIWAGDGDNILYGDAGDDIITGGGGNDKFVFGTDWGNDVISQLDGGTITLYFEGTDVFFDEISQLYTDGRNTLKINGSAPVILGDINTL
ncbi:MAG: AIDA repeat-containing protein [Lentisphaeria bacterium]|nr:AIDA repeat-containing protein [Lentisphaeria bacterium]